MPEWLYFGNPLRPLLAGVVYMLLSMLGNQAVWYTRHGVEGLRGPSAVRFRRWPGWFWLGQAFGLAVALAYPFALVIEGTFAAGDVGIGPIDWPLVLPWALLITAGAVGWLALLWVCYGAKDKSPEANGSRAMTAGLMAILLLDAVRHEATLATYRAALMPFAGAYWGVWLAVLWRLLMARVDPALRLALCDAQQRSIVHLAWALDWVGAVLYVYTRSAGIALLGHSVCCVVVLIVWRRISVSRRQRRTALLSVNGQGQNDQDDKHAGRENA